MKLRLRLIALVGLLVFVPLFAATFLSPIQVERAARGYIESNIKDRIEDTLGVPLDKAQESPLGRLAEKLAEQNKEKLDALRAQIASGLNERIAAEVARLQDLNCECRELLRRGLDIVTAGKMSELESVAPQLLQIIEGNYVEIVSSLMLDVRIFAGTNVIAFLALLAILIIRQDRARQSLIPGVLLAVSTALAAILYIFGQNWFFTILHADYMGWGYTIWVAVIFGFLIDIGVFEARMTMRILNALGSAASSATPSC